MAKIRTIAHLSKHFGLRWLIFRLQYALYLRAGLAKRKTMPGTWENIELDEILAQPGTWDAEKYFDHKKDVLLPFFFSPEHRNTYRNYFHTWDHKEDSISKIADRILHGKFRYFSRHEIQTGFPPDWHLNAFTGQKSPSDKHWSELPDFGFGDIKAIWEPSRFEFAFTLTRAFWLTGNNVYPEAFWNLFEDWCRSNPPNTGVNWKCGQEISFRLMAGCFAFYGFWGHPATTPARTALFLKFVHASGKRIAANTDYAVSQQNNHGISEGVGLWTIGCLFPELADARGWLEEGRSILENLARTLIYPDGAFAQHSVNYHRLMLQDYIWAVRLGDIVGNPFSQEIKDRLLAAGKFLFQIMNIEDGRAPYYGQNDGASILPLNNCDYLDFRPVVQAVHYLCTGKRCLEPGPWDEDLLWLFGPEALDADIELPEQQDLQADHGGCYALRTGSSFVFVRCADYRHRPGQADQLHVDLWWKGQNIAIDPGTYSYNAEPPWQNPLARTFFHNTVSVNDLDQMDRAGKFMWLPWSKGAVKRLTASVGQYKYWEGSHDGYTRLKPAVLHRRGILNIDEDTWLILDRMESDRLHEYRLHWLLADFPYEWQHQEGRMALQTGRGRYSIQAGALEGKPRYSVERADENSPRGWKAHYYYYKEPAISLDMRISCKTAVMWSLFGPHEYAVVTRKDGLVIHTPKGHPAIDIGLSKNEVLIRSANHIASNPATH